MVCSASGSGVATSPTGIVAASIHAVASAQGRGRNLLTRYGLSKSKLTAFEQCAKRLWLQVHRPDLLEVDSASQPRFAAGQRVGEIACALAPEGRMVSAESGLETALDETQRLLNEADRKPIFEATLEHDGVLVRVDILEPDGDDAWAIAEVKSTTGAKAHHLGDLATQLWVARGAGLNISQAAIRHIDNTFVLRREGDYRGLFADAVVDQALEPVTAGRAALVLAAREVLAGAEPDIAPGAHCEAPFLCEFAAYCAASLPDGPEWPVTVLPNGGGRRWLESGVTDLFAIDPQDLSNAVHRRVHKATVTGAPFHDRDGARAAMSNWAWPRTWLDFETIGFAAPRWVGTRPYQQIPFQFSAHVEAEDGAIVHQEFLSLDGSDPRRACAEALLRLPVSGAVVGYNAGFERRCILELAAHLPDLAEGLRLLAHRLVDLLPVTRACWYHRDQRGSWSIKAVLPTVAPHLDYVDLDVSDGGKAQEAYIEAVDPLTTPERRDALKRALRIYCGRDTEAMIVLARQLWD